MRKLGEWMESDEFADLHPITRAGRRTSRCSASTRGQELGQGRAPADELHSHQARLPARGHPLDRAAALLRGAAVRERRPDEPGRSSRSRTASRPPRSSWTRSTACASSAPARSRRIEKRAGEGISAGAFLIRLGTGQGLRASRHRPVLKSGASHAEVRVCVREASGRGAIDISKIPGRSFCR